MGRVDRHRRRALLPHLQPDDQGERFDKQGEFIRRWLPELQDVPDSAIHQPHARAEKNNKKLDYPAPIVEHKAARKDTRRLRARAQQPEAVTEPL